MVLDRSRELRLQVDAAHIATALSFSLSDVAGPAAYVLMDGLHSTVPRKPRREASPSDHGDTSRVLRCPLAIPTIGSLHALARRPQPEQTGGRIGPSCNSHDYD